MLLRVCRSDTQERSFGTEHELSTAVLNVLQHCYVRESQHAIRCRKHAERIHRPEFRQELLTIAAEEQAHAESLRAKIHDFGGDIPEVIPVHVANEQNLWAYLRTDLDEEERCVSELETDLLLVFYKSPEIARLLSQIDKDCKRHWVRIRAMLADSDPLSPGPP